jgi:hypothetical protein
MVMTLTTTAFADGGRIPTRFTCDGDNISPPLAWDGVPADVLSFALVCSDPDAPAGTWYHWAVFDVPATVRHLDEAYPTEARVDATRQATNDFRRSGYGGPCPPRGHGPHRYRFHLLALAVATLEVGDRADCRAVEKAAGRHVLAETVLTGTYGR